MKTIQCPRCTMTFEVADEPWRKQGSKAFGRCEITRCAEPQCRKPFWHSSRRTITSSGADTNHIRVGIERDWLHEWGYERREIDAMEQSA